MYIPGQYLIMQKSEMFHQRIYVLFLRIKNSILHGYILGSKF